jgi:hypothetical protein
MSSNDQIPNGNDPKNSITEEKESNIIPLERCPHLYIKHTATKGKSPQAPLYFPSQRTRRRCKRRHATRHFPLPYREKRTKSQNQKQAEPQPKLTTHRPRRLLLPSPSSLHHPRHLARPAPLPSRKHITHCEDRTLPLHLQLAGTSQTQPYRNRRQPTKPPATRIRTHNSKTPSPHPRPRLHVQPLARAPKRRLDAGCREVSDRLSDFEKCGSA